MFWGRTISRTTARTHEPHIFQPDHEALLTVASVDTSYPAFARAQNWGGVEFYQVAKLQLPQASPDIRVAAKFSDGSPLFIDRKIGAGHALIFASVIDNKTNDPRTIVPR